MQPLASLLPQAWRGSMYDWTCSAAASASSAAFGLFESGVIGALGCWGLCVIASSAQEVPITLDGLVGFLTGCRARLGLQLMGYSRVAIERGTPQRPETCSRQLWEGGVEAAASTDGVVMIGSSGCV